MKLILHIGMHKTGSTSIQQSLLLNKKELKRRGWHLFHSGPDGKRELTGNANKWVNFSGSKQDFTAYLDLEIMSQLRKIRKNVILSAEELSWVNRPEHIAEIKAALSSHFTDIQIIIYLRRQDRQFLSHFQQGYKYLHSTARVFYGDHLLDTIEHQDYYHHYLNYYNKVKMWADFFGKSKVNVRIFEPKQLHGGDIIHDFYQAAGLDQTLAKPLSTNEAFSLQRQFIHRSLFNFSQDSWYAFKRLDWKPVASQKLSKALKLQGGFAESIIQHYTDSNTKLSAYLGCKGALFSIEDLPARHNQESPINTEDASEILGSVLDTFYNMTLSTFVKLKFRKHKRIFYDKLKSAVNGNSSFSKKD